MSEQVNSTSALSQRGRALGALARRMREILGRADMESENHRKAALRRLLHEHAAGLTREETGELVEDLRDRFPDRIFESVSSARGLASRSAELEEEVGHLREERDRLRKQVDRLESLMTRLSQAAGMDAVRAPGSAETQEALVEVAALLFAFALNQEQTARSVEETLGRGSAAPKPGSLTTLIPLLSGEKPPNREDLEAIRRRLEALQLLPGALLAGAQQSWKGGTREILEHLDPKTAEKSIAGVLKSPAILKDVKQRFEQFWDQFDRNVEHYYRGRFERAYRDKMEDLP